MSKLFKVYVDGQAGTTGLKIYERLMNHPFIEILQIPEALRKDTITRTKFINEADIVFLCLPDQAAKEAVSLVCSTNTHTKIIDASTAHRTSSDWAYGIPELSSDFRKKIEASSRVAVPGCHASSFILPLYPLIQAGIVPKDYPIACHSITGYSGGGKQMIAEYTNQNRQSVYPDYDAPRQYALGLTHKHLPEMQAITGLSYKPIFSPIVADFCQGLAVSIPLNTHLLNQKVTAKDVHEFLSSYYKDAFFVKVMDFTPSSCEESNFFHVKACNDTNDAQIFVFGNEEQIMLMTRLDNLGKGASGAAIQNMNIMLGLDETISLV